jgi:isopenicillin-N epimerase
LYVRQEKIAEVWPSIVSVGWNKDALTTRIASKKFETLGQRDDGGVSAVATAVDFHRTIGVESIEARTTALATALKDGLARIKGVKLVTPMDPQLSGGVVISQMPDLDRAKMSALVKDLYDKYGIAGAATGGLRLSPHVYNTMADIDLAIRGVRELLA